MYVISILQVLRLDVIFARIAVTTSACQRVTSLSLLHYFHYR